jgi:serine/threonine-protein kinase
LGSTNGTFVNNSRINDIYLQDGDRINCGSTIFEVTIPNPTASDTPTCQFSPGKQDPATATVDSSPKRLADFEITRELGRGAMGVVYHGIHRSSGREAAVKIIRPENAAGDDAVQLFLREASILSQLKHRRIVEYLSLGLHERRMYLAMEYLPVIDFQEKLKRQSRAKQVQLACAVMSRVLEGLEFAHRAGIVHRDVKPSNILVYAVGKKIQAKLADFGLAKNYANAGFSSISRENEVRGTLNYMAPEQLINCRFSKPPCDIYACGACLYHYLSGKLPYDLDDAQSAIGRILNTPPPPLASRVSDLSPVLTNLVDRALAHDPGQRFATAELMREALLPFAVKRAGR